jgi:hypothetical protein
MIKYYTKAWQDECVKRVNADPVFEQEAKKLSGTYVFRVYDGPDGKDRMMTWVFKQGKITDFSYEAQAAPWQELRNSAFTPTWAMRGSCPFNMMAALNKGEMTPMRALSSPHYKLEGNKMVLMQLMRPMGMWNDICAKVEVTYEFTSEDEGEATSAETPAQETAQAPAEATETASESASN